MKIIVEGMDNVGKTTLINKIIKDFPGMNFRILHGTSSTPNNYLYYMSALLSDENIIFDRAWVGQFIYQTAKERYTKRWLSDFDKEVIESFVNFHSDEFICLYVTSPIEQCYEMCKKDSQDSHYTLDYIKELNEKYENYMNSSIINWIKINNDFTDKKRSSYEKDIDYSSLPYIVAVDFDGTLFNNAFPDITQAIPNEILINNLKRMSRENSTRLILWTNRSGKSLEEAVVLCESYGLKFDAINDNIHEVKELGLNPRKVYANLYIDDKAVCNRFYIKEV